MISVVFAGILVSTIGCSSKDDSNKKADAQSDSASKQSAIKKDVKKVEKGVGSPNKPAESESYPESGALNQAVSPEVQIKLMTDTLDKTKYSIEVMKKRIASLDPGSDRYAQAERVLEQLQSSLESLEEKIDSLKKQSNSEPVSE